MHVWSLLQVSKEKTKFRAANAELKAFKSGDKYVQMEQTRMKEVRALERQVAVLKKELADSRSHIVTIRNQWFEIFEQVQKECDRKLAEARKELERMEKRALKAERQRDDALTKVTEQRHELYKIKTELEDEKEKNRKLTAQFNRDYENSSIPSSKSVNHKKIRNSREKSGKKPGGQPGRKGYVRKKQEPTKPPVKLPPPPEVLNDPDGKVLYSASEKKGHEGVKGTAAENYQSILVHDHEATFYHYGTNHQECLAHVLRYLKDSMANEPDRT